MLESSIIRDIGDIKRLCAILEESIKENKKLLESLLKLLEEKDKKTNNKKKKN